MWPVLLNLTRDECRLTLRRLELEAYSNMIDVFRAQGALEDSRKKLLEELRAVLHISQDRHSAEARRVANDQLLATIAEKLSGPNTSLAWICEGRRRIPLLPRGVPQTAYTEIADKAAEAAAVENKELLKRLTAEKLAPKHEESAPETESETAEETLSSNEADETFYPPIAMEDQTTKLWETELLCRKRKPDSSSADEAAPPIKNMRNIPVNTNQKHLNLSQIYSKFSQPVTSKPASQSKHSYNQVSKVSTSKSSQAHTPRSTPHKPRAPKTPKAPKTPRQPKSQSKKAQAKAQELLSSPSKQFGSSTPLEYSGPPNTFQASYAQSVLGGKLKTELGEIKPKVMSSASMMSESATMQLLTQPATLPHELEVSENAHPDEPHMMHTQTPNLKQSITGKPCHLVLQNRGDIVPDKKPQKADPKSQYKSEPIKLLSNRQVVLTPSSTPKSLNAPGKLVTTKVIGSLPKSRPSNNPVMSEKMIVVSKPASETKSAPGSKIIMTSTVTSTPVKERSSTSTNTIPRSLVETLTPKGIPATDLKVSAKAVVLNPKSGQKMVVVPAKSRTKPEIPLLHFKGISTAMKLLPVSSQTQVVKSSPVTVVSRPSTIPSKVIGMEPIKTANLADIVPVKGLTPTTPKISNPIVRPSSAKGNVIVVQKGSNLGKALTFAKNGNDMSKIIMGKNVTQLLQASKSDHSETAKTAGNVIVLELNNEQTGRPTTMSEILDSRGPSGRTPDKKIVPITQDTPVLFDNQITEETTNSLDSTAESISGITQIEGSGLSLMGKTGKTRFKGPGGAKDSSVTDWEMELDTVGVVPRKDKEDDDKLNSMHLDLGMSSDSDNEYMATGRKKSKRSQEIQQATTSGESGTSGVSGVFSSSSAMSLATRTLLSQLQDDGSSSNDSSFALKAKIVDKTKDDPKLDRVESDELTKAKEKLSEKVAEARSQQKRIDIYSTAITTSDINLDSFAYLDESIMAGDDVFAGEENKSRETRRETLDEQLSRLLGEDSPHSTDSQTVSENMPLSK